MTLVKKHILEALRVTPLPFRELQLKVSGSRGSIYEGLAELRTEGYVEAIEAPEPDDEELEVRIKDRKIDLRRFKLTVRGQEEAQMNNLDLAAETDSDMT